MAIKVQSSFSAGELDPALHERTTFDKYKSGLEVARNVIVGKTGRLISRMGRRHLIQTKTDSRQVLIYSPRRSGLLLEWGELYVRVYSIDPKYNGNIPYGTLVGEYAHDWTVDDMPFIRFDYNNGYVYLFRSGKPTKQFFPGPGGGFTTATMFNITATPTAGTITATVSNGYSVEYVVTCVRNGQESQPFYMGASKLPIANSEQVVLNATLGTIAGMGNYTEMRVYRRPQAAGAYGYIGSTSSITSDVPTATVKATFTDLGGTADYTHAPPTYGDLVYGRGGATGPAGYLSRAGCFYQQRLVLTATAINGEIIEASRPGYPNNFTRDYPYSADSAILFKCGASQNASVLHLVESDGLVAFTTAGIWVHTGALTPTNLTMTSRGNWIIDETVPPIKVPGGTIFIDSATNTVRVLRYSNEAGSYTADELSLYSNHLFNGKKVASWALHEGDVPLLWVVFVDGTYASFTYEESQEMRAWTRHDSAYPVESVCSTGINDTTAFVTVKGTKRYIELTVPRYTSAALIAANANNILGESIAPLDGLKTFNQNAIPAMYAGDTITVTPTVPGDWSSDLYLQTGTPVFTTIPVGTKYKVFASDGSACVLTVTVKNANNKVTARPDQNFDPTLANFATFYIAQNTFTGLDHLEGESVAVICDGYVVGSPNNDQQNYDVLTVTGGTLTLPSEIYGAFVHIGRPITMDMQTLDIDTVEQRPVLIESLTVNKLYVKVLKSRGLYVGTRFPLNNKVVGMEDIDLIDVTYQLPTDVIADRYLPLVTRRIEVMLPGDWRSSRIAIRQVDAIHFEILSIIPDLDDLRR